MKNVFYVVLICFLTLSTTACQLTKSGIPKSNPSIILEGETYMEADIGKFITWRCTDKYEAVGTLVEVGIIDDPEFQEIGFVLYDKTNVGTFTLYSRDGIDRRWDWGGENMRKYAITIEPNGDGAYFEFTGVKAGESTTARAIYKCYQ